MKNKKKIIILILVLIMIIATSTYAWITWRSSNNNNMNVTVGSLITFQFTGGNAINTSSLSPVLGYEDQSTTLVPQINMSAQNRESSSKDVKFYLTITSIDTNLISDSLKYVLLSSTDNSTFTEVTSGDFSSASTTNGLVISSNVSVPVGTTYYRFLIYLDGEVENSNNMQNVGISATLNVEEIPGPVSFSTDSWETIAANTNSSAYSVGDTKCIALDGFTTTNENGCDDGEFLVRIANNTTPSDCDADGYSQTACGFVIEFVDIINTHVMNPSTTDFAYGTNVGSWPATEMRTYVNEDIYEALPSELSSVIINTSVVSGYGSSDSSNFTSTDKIYLLSPKEVWNYTGTYDTAKDNTRQLDYYSGLGVTTSSYSGAIKYRNGSAATWWLRAPYSGADYIFFVVRGDGAPDIPNADWDGGVSPAFRIGS